MMVNQVNYNPLSWQSTVPQQMPWMSPYGLTDCTIQFGQPNSLAAQATNQPVTPSQGQVDFRLADGNTTTSTDNPIAPNGLPAAAHSNMHQTNVQTQFYNQSPPSTTAPLYCRPQRSFDPMRSLHLMPSDTSPTSQVKRRLGDIEDDLVETSEPPTKQVLSENKLFKRFGSLHLNPQLNESGSRLRSDSSDSSDDDDQKQATSVKSSDREEFQRYVYLLFKDRRQALEDPSNSFIQTLAREERDKLQKAVVLWHPRTHYNQYGTVEEVESDDDQESFKYNDHTDFYKDRNSSVTIEEIFDDDPSNNPRATNQTCFDVDMSD